MIKGISILVLLGAMVFCLYGLIAVCGYYLRISKAQMHLKALEAIRRDFDSKKITFREFEDRMTELTRKIIYDLKREERS